MENILGNNIKKYRIKYGMTQQTVADYLDISRGEFNYYENGNRQIPSNLISKLADLFAIEEYDLYEENDAIVYANVAFAFRADTINTDDLKVIANFKKIALNYLKMKKALQNE